MHISGKTTFCTGGTECGVLLRISVGGRPAARIGDEDLKCFGVDFGGIGNASGGQAPGYGDMAANGIAGAWCFVRGHTTQYAGQYAELTLSIEPYRSAA
ncbi:hypothetical protein TPA0909_12910 [Streptomyces albus]|nr:hypothetical protein TPA0909_12910 [Streptomyces albus]